MSVLSHANAQQGGRARSHQEALHQRRPATLCWRCRHAAGQHMCSWARWLQPVEGWQATPSFLEETFKGERMTLRSYHVHACPQFEADAPRNGKGGTVG